MQFGCNCKTVYRNKCVKTVLNTTQPPEESCESSSIMFSSRGSNRSSEKPAQPSSKPPILKF